MQPVEQRAVLGRDAVDVGLYGLVYLPAGTPGAVKAVTAFCHGSLLWSICPVALLTAVPTINHRILVREPVRPVFATRPGRACPACLRITAANLDR